MSEPKPVYKPKTDLLKEGALLAAAKAEKFSMDATDKVKTPPPVKPVTKPDVTAVNVQADREDAPLVTRGKDVDDKRIQSPFGRSRGNNDAWEMQQQEENERAKSATAGSTVSVVDSRLAGAKEQSEEEQIRIFVKRIPDGGIIVLESKGGQARYYRRMGDDLLKGKEGKGDIDTFNVWKKINDGWGWKIAQKEIPSKKSARLVTKSHLKGEPLVMVDGEKTEDDYASGKVFAEQYLEVHPPRAEAEIRLDDVIEEAERIDEKISEQYGELFLGDMWVAKNSDGSKKRIFITAFPEYGMVDIRKGADALKLREEPERNTATNSIIAGTIDLETLRNTLRGDGYLREDRGSKSEKEFSEMKQGDSVRSSESPQQQRIDELSVLVGEFRAAYVKEDVEATTTWKKLKSILGIERDTEKGEHQRAYEKALQELRNAEMEALRKNASLNREQLSEKVEQLLRYYKSDEAVNLINERTQYKAQNQRFSEKITDSLGALGRAYNRIPLKQKLLIAGAFAGLAIATTMSGGAAAGALASLVVTRRVVAGLGTAVATEAGLEKLGDWQRTSKAEKEIKEQLGMLGKESLGAKPEVTFDALNAFLEKDIASLDTKLQSEKRAKTWRKLGAVAVGATAGYFIQTVIEKIGVTDWMNDHLKSIFGGTHATHSNVVTGRIINLPITIEPGSLPSEPVGGGLPPVQPEDIQAPVEANAAQGSSIDTFINRNIVVEKGDSVWKIAGGLADKLGLEDAQRTHFIDTLKDQYGDVRLKAGETINFSSHGIDKGFVENALSQTKALSPDQIASITTNDVKIAEFAASHPGTTLDNAVVDGILHGETLPQLEAVTVGDGNAFQSVDTRVAQGIESPITTKVPNISSGSVEQAIRDNIAFTNPKAYLAEHPGDFSRFNSTLGRIRMNIFMMNIGDAGTPPEYDYALNNKLGTTKISDVLKDLRNFDRWGLEHNKELNPLHYDQMKDVVNFTEASKVAFGEEFSQVEAGENIDSYTRRMATAALRTGKEIKGFFKP